MLTARNGLSILLVALIVTGCTSRASSIAPTSVSSANYKGLDCEETRALLTQKTVQRDVLAGQQDDAATGDAVGVFFTLLPLSTVFGADKEGELAQAKGEVMALEGAVPINCEG